MSSEFECLFRHDISPKSTEPTEIVKFVTVNRKGSDGMPFLQVRLFKSIRPYYKPTNDGVSLSLRQTRMLMELAENHLTLHEQDPWKEYLTPEGVHNLTGDAWIIVAKDGKEVMVMRKNGEGLKGIALSVEEYSTLRRCFGAVHHIMFPAPCPQDVEIIEPLAYEIRSILSVMRKEKCNGCSWDSPSQLEHECITMDDEMLTHCYFAEAISRVNLSRVLTHMEYLHGLLKCGNPLPTAEDVKKYYKDCEWYVNFAKKRSSIELLLTSFDELHDE